MGRSEVSIMRGLEPSEVARLRKPRDLFRLRDHGEFFWTDLAAAGGPSAGEVATAFGLSDAVAGALFDFAERGSPARRVHVEEELIVFAFWCAATPEPEPLAGAEGLGLFRVNVCLHGDFLLTVHEREFDLPGAVAPGGIPAGRSERYAVFVPLQGMAATLVQALAAVEREIAAIESSLLDSGRRGADRDEQAVIGSLRSRLTTLRMRIAAERGLLGRVIDEIEHVPGLEPDREAYFDRITGELDRAVDRIDAASSALSHMLDIELNVTTFRLTVIATIFLPLTFLTGFFGMNFGWLVDRIDSPLAFWLLGVGLMTGPLLLVLALLRGGEAAERLQHFGRSLIRR